MRSFIRAIRVIPVALLLASSAAFAAPTPEALAQATAAHNEGVTLLAAGKYRESAAKFMVAYEKNANPNELFNAARAELTAGRHKEAMKLFRAYLALPNTDRITVEFRKESTEGTKACQIKLCAVDVRGATESWIDSEPVSGVAYVEPGAHEVTMNGDAGPKTKKVSCVAQQTLLVDYTDRPAGPGPKGPVVGDPPPVPTEKGSWVVPGVLAGVGVVGLGVGIATALAANGSDSDAKAASVPGVCADLASPTCLPVKDAASSARSMSTVSVVGYVAGGAFLAGAVVSALVIQPWKERPTKAGSLRVVPGFGGVWATGTF